MANAVTEWPNGGCGSHGPTSVRPSNSSSSPGWRPEDFEGRMVVSDDPDVHRAAIQRHLDLGFDRVYLHNVGRNQREWIDVFGRDVLPKLVRS